MPGGVPSELEMFLLDKVSRYRMPSLVVGLIEGGEASFRAYGYSSLEYGKPASPRTLYGIGSITKSFTALSILMLQREGLLSLDSPVGEYLGMDLSIDGTPITVSHLLTHTSGVPATAYAEALIRGFIGEGGYWKPYSNPWDAVLYLKRALELGWAVARPGERFFYLNEGYVALGVVIEKVSGTDYTDFVRSRIFEPLGMKSSGFLGGDLTEEIATPYKPGDRPSKVALPGGITADGGIVSNAIDLARYAHALSSRSTPIGELAPDMEKPRIEVPWQALGGESYGYGLIVHPDFYGKTLASHGGSLLAYTAWMGYIPGEEMGFVALSNTTGYPLSLAGMAALSTLMGRGPRDPKPVRLFELLEKLEGRYEGFDSSISFDVKIAGSALIVEPVGGGGKFVLIPEEVPPVEELDFRGSTSFRVPYMGGSMEAEFSWNGDRVELVIERYKAVKKL